MKSLGNIRRDPESPCKDFWHALRIGAGFAIIIFFMSWGFAEWLMR
jgi:hypothetical protein